MILFSFALCPSPGLVAQFVPFILAHTRRPTIFSIVRLQMVVRMTYLCVYVFACSFVFPFDTDDSPIFVHYVFDTFHVLADRCDRITRCTCCGTVKCFCALQITAARTHWPSNSKSSFQCLLFSATAKEFFN